MADVGRPPIESPSLGQQFYNAGKLQLTREEIAMWLGCSKSWVDHTLSPKSARPELKERWEAGKAFGLRKLRRRQFDIAHSDSNKGSASMAIHLGKQYLGQSDKTEVSGPGGGPIQIMSTTIALSDHMEAAKIYQQLMMVGKVDGAQ